MIRPAVPSDLPGVDALLARSYPRLLKADYPASVLVTALPLISRARPELLASGTYWVAEEDGAVRACGGWTAAAPAGGGGDAPGTGHVRHVATDPGHLRRGLARAVMEAALAQADARGARRMECLSTRTAVPFYAALGFRAVGKRDVTLRPGVAFPAVAMVRG